jgi:GT2 family glycosyltransferase
VSAATIAVAVVSWNTCELLERCLRSFEPEHERGMAEVWVVDNASDDGSADMVAEKFPWVKLVASEDNLGFGKAVNLVADRTSTAWVAPANADIAVRPGALDTLLEAAERDPRAGAVAPRLVLPGGNTQHSVYAFPSIPFALVLQTGAFRLWRGLGDRMAFPGHWDTERARRVPWAVGAFMIVRREAWDQAGGFDERQWMYAEDLDLGWRLRQAGWFTRYEPRAVVDHYERASTTKAWGKEVAPVWQRSTYGFMARRYPMYRTWAIALINLVGQAVRWLAPASRRDPEAHAALGRWVLVHARALRSRATLERHR